MCGIAGYIGVKAELALAKRLLIAVEVRGHDATGYVEINADGRYALRKQAVRARQFVETMSFEYRGDNHTFLGHTRYATSDNAKETLAAHPFVGDRFIVFHNGSIQGFDQKRLSEKFGIVAPHGVDSELFLAFLEQRGSVDALRTEFLPCLTNGSVYALVIFDKVTKSIHFMRCNGRPIAFGRDASGGLYYASTVKILQKTMGKRLVTVEMLQPYTHYEIASFSGELLRKCAIEPSKASIDYSDATCYIKSTGKPIRFF